MTLLCWCTGFIMQQLRLMESHAVRPTTVDGVYGKSFAGLITRMRCLMELLDDYYTERRR